MVLSLEQHIRSLYVESQVSWTWLHSQTMPLTSILASPLVMAYIGMWVMQVCVLPLDL